jgi:hypothetical protein
MDNKYIVIVLVSGMFFATEAFCKKISSDLIKDMANMGYYQKEINGKILWTKDSK